MFCTEIILIILLIIWVITFPFPVTSGAGPASCKLSVFFISQTDEINLPDCLIIVCNKVAHIAAAVMQTNINEIPCADRSAVQADRAAVFIIGIQFLQKRGLRRELIRFPFLHDFKTAPFGDANTRDISPCLPSTVRFHCLTNEEHCSGKSPFLYIRLQHENQHRGLSLAWHLMTLSGLNRSFFAAPEGLRIADDLLPALHIRTWAAFRQQSQTSAGKNPLHTL